jgi:hypothetical protein
MDKIRSGAPQARPILILLYITLHLALGRAPPGPPGRPGCTACEEHWYGRVTEQKVDNLYFSDFENQTHAPALYNPSYSTHHYLSRGAIAL